MSETRKGLLTILLMIAVLGYTIYNYATGRIDTTYFIVCAAIIGIPMINMINILLKSR